MKQNFMISTLQKMSLVTCLVLITGCSTSDFFLGKDNRPEPKELPVVTNSVVTNILWQKNLGDGGEEYGLQLQPAVDGETVYAVSADGRFYALNSENGSEKYKVKLQNDISAGVSVANGIAYIGTQGGDIIALDTADGHILWRDTLSSKMLSPPVASNNIVIARSIDGAISAYDQQGVSLWRYHLQTPLLTVRGNAAPVVGGGVVIITSDSGFFIVLDQNTGLPVAELRVASGRGNNPVARLIDMDATPQINNQILFGSAYQSMIFALNLADGAPIWQQPSLSTQQNFSLSPDKLFVTTDIDHVVALNQQDGSIVWRNDALEGRYISPTIAIPGKVGVVDGEGYLHWFALESGQLIGQTRIGKTLARSSAVVMKDRIVWQMVDGRLVALQPN